MILAAVLSMGFVAGAFADRDGEPGSHGNRHHSATPSGTPGTATPTEIAGNHPRNHGKDVSEAAHSIPPGPGHGEEVSEVVRSLGVALPYQGVRWYGEPPDEIRDEYFHQARLMRLDERTAKESSEPLSTRLWRRYAASALSLLDEIRQDPSMAEVLIRGTEYIRCELHYAAQREMVTKLEDFLRRRSKIALIARKAQIEHSAGLMEACRILFGDDAQAQFDEYFAELARRESVG